MTTTRHTAKQIKQSFALQTCTRSLLLLFWCCGAHCCRHVTYRRMAQNAENSSNELTDTILLVFYGEAERNSAAAACLYTERYLQRRHPNRKTFISQERRLRETGRTQPIMTNADRPRSRRSAGCSTCRRTIPW
jgi:hypothetical protein